MEERLRTDTKIVYFYDGEEPPEMPADFKGKVLCVMLPKVWKGIDEALQGRRNAQKLQAGTEVASSTHSFN